MNFRKSTFDDIEKLLKIIRSLEKKFLEKLLERLYYRLKEKSHILRLRENG